MFSCWRRVAGQLSGAHAVRSRRSRRQARTAAAGPNTRPEAEIANTAAAIGKATVLRHFGDVGGVVEAVLAPNVTVLQNAVSTGDPPLGPGRSPHDGLHAFLDALFDFVLNNL